MQVILDFVPPIFMALGARPSNRSLSVKVAAAVVSLRIISHRSFLSGDMRREPAYSRWHPALDSERRMMFLSGSLSNC